jgi:ubiquinone biosynthesis protein Coq4
MTNTNLEKFYTEEVLGLTIFESLERHYDLNPQFTRWYNYKNPTTQKMIKSHDITHLVFGCDVSYGGEFTVQTWAKYAVNTNIKPFEIHKYIWHYTP